MKILLALEDTDQAFLKPFGQVGDLPTTVLVELPLVQLTDFSPACLIAKIKSFSSFVSLSLVSANSVRKSFLSVSKDSMEAMLSACAISPASAIAVATRFENLLKFVIKARYLPSDSFRPHMFELLPPVKIPIKVTFVGVIDKTGAPESPTHPPPTDELINEEFGSDAVSRVKLASKNLGSSVLAPESVVTP
jgi:hypothetical protein